MSSPPRVRPPHPRPAADPLFPAAFPAGQPLDNSTKHLRPHPAGLVPERPTGGPPGARGGGPRPPVSTARQRFVDRYGWRAYALPVLVVVTVVALAVTLMARHPAPAATRGSAGPVVVGPTPGPGRADVRPSAAPRARKVAPTRAATSTGETSKPTARHASEAVTGDALPAGAAYTHKGAGTFRALPGGSPVVGHGPLRRYVVVVENGVTGVDLQSFAATVVATLSDDRSWTAGGTVSLQRVSSTAAADFRIALTSSMTVRTLCGYEQKIETSCWENDRGPSQVNLNVARWVRGDAQFGHDLAMYRRYMVNHEVGHAIGHVHTYQCLPNGLAPVMMQQTITLKENQGQGPRVCRPNAWPFPPGVAPGVAVPS